MMKRFFNLALVATVAMMMASCMSINLGENGGVYKTPTQVTGINQVTTMNQFDEVEIGGAFKVIYEQSSGDCSVRIEASEQALKEMTVYVKDGQLRIRQAVKKPTVSFKDVKIYVTSPDIKCVDLAGSGVFTASNPVEASEFIADLAGSGKIMLVQMTCDKAVFDIAGSGNIEFGKLDVKNTAKADIAGSGDINLGGMTCAKFNIDSAGSGNVNCDNITADDVHVDIAGSGDVNLKGAVKHHTKDVAGSGKVNIN
jgi:hypothetical protein